MIRMLSFLLICVCHSLKKGDSNVCSGKKEELFCCFNHRYYNDTCVECATGSVSINGSPCKICEEGKYGYACSMTCNCGEYQRFDPRKGCVNSIDFAYNTVSHTTESKIVFATIIDTTTELYVSISTENDFKESASVHQTSEPILIVYIAVVAGIMVLLGLLYPLIQCIRKSRSIKEKDKTIVIAESIVNIEMEPSVYEEIDEYLCEL